MELTTTTAKEHTMTASQMFAAASALETVAEIRADYGDAREANEKRQLARKFRTEATRLATEAK